MTKTTDGAAELRDLLKGLSRSEMAELYGEEMTAALLKITYRQVKFSFDDGVMFDGFADGTTWNGFDNVAVTPATLEAIRAHLNESEPRFEDQADGEAYWPPVGADGLIDLSGGFATVIVGE